MFNRISFFLVLPLLCGCTLLSNNEAIPHFSYDAPPGREDAQKDFPPDFPMDSIVETGRDLDIAIIGEGYFVCSDAWTGEVFYTRIGHLNVDHEGRMVFWDKLPSDHPTIAGYVYSYPLEPAIAISRNTERIQISDDGMVWALQANSLDLHNIGQIELATFAHPDGLEQVKENLYRETEASGRATIHLPGRDGKGPVKSQYLEVSRTALSL